MEQKPPRILEICFDNELKFGPIEISSLALYIVDGT